MGTLVAVTVTGGRVTVSSGACATSDAARNTVNENNVEENTVKERRRGKA
jgi:hypothetical protein